MSKIPLPERGQPLDLSYIYNIAKAINDLSDQNNSLAQANGIVIDNGSGVQSSRISGAQMVGKFITVSSSSSVNAQNEHSETINFSPVKFAKPPIVTASLVNLGGTSTGTDSTIILKNISTDSCTVVVKFGSTGLTSIGVNIIAIGLPTK
jgi:hypothetical protein